MKNLLNQFFLTKAAALLITSVALLVSTNYTFAQIGNIKSKVKPPVSKPAISNSSSNSTSKESAQSTNNETVSTGVIIYVSPTGNNSN
ncbi:MAG: hypothetical protein RLO12_09800, partial [Fulvivirga sp.]